MLAKYKNIIIIVVIIILGFVVYSILKKDPETESLLQSSGPQEVQILGEDIIQALNQIDSLVLDPSILNDPIIHSLTDHGRPIEEELYQRDNPFAPIGGGITPAEGEEEVEAEEEFTL